MGVYTALVAMLVPDGNSFHDIAVTPEWWVLPAILIIVNSKKPLEAALKTFVFFLISQPLVYLVQVPFNDMGWGLFGYYRYWFMITLLTFPGGFIGWFIKKDKWYSALILAVMTIYLAATGVGYAIGLADNFPNHLVSMIYCFGIIPIFIFGIFKDKKARIINAILTVLGVVVFVALADSGKMYETYNNSFVNDYNITFVGEPYVSRYLGSNGKVELRSTEDGYVLDLSGKTKNVYEFDISDDENTYQFKYYYDNEEKTVKLEKR